MTVDEQIKAALDGKFISLQNELKALQDSGATKDEILNIHNQISDIGNSVQLLEDAIKERKIKTFTDDFRAFLISNKEALDRMKNSKSGVIEFTSKAVGDISTANGGDGIIVPPANMNTSLGSFNLRNDNALLSLCSVSSTSSSSLVYTELEPKDGDYTFVLEGGTKPQIDFKWQNRYATPKKIAAYEVFSEEVVDDIERILSVAREYLKKKHDLFKVNAIFFADGIGDNPLGATTVGRAFVAGNMALKVANPNFMDVVNAAITDIYTTHNYTDEASYMPNIVLINPIDFYLNLVSAKDANGLPLYPQAGLFNQVSIGGVTIKPWEKIPVGKLFVADMSKYNVANYKPYTVRLGWINDQFITNQFTMVGESRFFTWVKELDKQAFIYDDIATIETAITPI